jgi:uncharacterized iron-regulated membrane protein
MGTLIPRLTRGKRIFWRDLHAVPAFWLSLGIAFLIMTGLPWSRFWGEYVQKLATNTGVGYPAAVWWGEKPESTIPSKDVADVPWAAEQRPVPQSTEEKIFPVSIDKVVEIANARHVHPGYNVYFPKDPTGVYTVSIFPNKAEDEATLYLDQYSGKVLDDYRFDDYGPIAKIIATGITLHKGSQFGLPNQIAGLIVCLGIVAITVTGLIMWWNRKPQGKLGAPALPKNFKLTKAIAAIILGFGIFFPLVGISLILMLVLDWLVMKRIPAVKQFLNA